MMPRIPSTRLPIIITERAYARAVLAALDEGMSLAEYTEAALAEAVLRTEHRNREAGYAAACEAARVSRRPNPTQQEVFGLQQQPFVRRQRSASENQAGRPSSRHDPEGRQRTPGQRREAGAEPPGATRSAASMARTGEHPPVDLAEQPGVTSDGVLREPPGGGRPQLRR
jgi:hypothetical protein